MLKIITLVLGSMLFAFNLHAVVYNSSLPSITPLSQEFRNEITQYIEKALLLANQQQPIDLPDTLTKKWDNSIQTTDWDISLTLFQHGEQVAYSHYHGKHLVNTLNRGTEALVKSQPNLSDLKSARIIITFNYYPASQFSFISWQNTGLELIGKRVAIRALNTAQLQQTIQNGAHYLLQAINPTWHGVYKFYNAKQNIPQNKLRTIYTSSTLYTLLKVNKRYPSIEITQLINPIAKFILSMQIQGGKNQGAFYYGFKLPKGVHTNTVVVGTTSKAIFTLIELYKLYHDPRYLTAAKYAGNWLITRVNPDATIIAKSDYIHDLWKDSIKQSYLYSGQVLSALSRLYILTEDPKYYQAATIIAKSFIKTVNQQCLPVSDDYRDKHPVSTSWVMMALIDYAKIEKDREAIATIKTISQYLASTQINAPFDIENDGRFTEATTPSGNGWINEVFGEYQRFCLEANLKNCEQYVPNMIKVSRWLIQNAYTPENTYDIKDPTQALGGFINTVFDGSVRTDSVCHGVNSLIYLLDAIGDKNQLLLYLPERPFTEILSDLRVGL